jgi:3-oxoadipate enol-lactonase
MTQQVQFADGPRHRIAYRRSGPGQGNGARPAVLLHPLALSGAAWGEFATRLAGSFDVIAPDARGHGDSGWDGGEFGIDDLGDDVAALLDVLGLPAAHVIGLSMGGSTAVNFAGRHPGRASAVFLADTTAWYGEQAADAWAARAQDVLAKPRERQVPFQVDRWFTEGFRRRHPAEVNRVTAIFLGTNSLAHAQACRALGAMDSRGLLPKITAPLRVVTGEEDYATPPDMGRTIADGVPGGQATVLDGLRHLSLIEEPALADAATAFFRGTTATTGGLSTTGGPGGPAVPA